MDRRVLITDEASGRLLELHLDRATDTSVPVLAVQCFAFSASTCTFVASPQATFSLPLAAETHGTVELLAAAFVDDEHLGMHSLFLVVYLPQTPHVALVRVTTDPWAVDDVFLLEVGAWCGHRCHARLVDGPRIMLYSSTASAMQILTLNDDSFLSSAGGDVDVPSRGSVPRCFRIGNHLLLHTVTDHDTHAWYRLPLAAQAMPDKRMRQAPLELTCCPYIPQPFTTTCIFAYDCDDDTPARLFLGTTSPSLVEYRHGCAVASLQLPGPPIDIQHAQVDTGDGVLAVLCNDAHRTLVIVAANDNTLTIVQEVALVDRVIVADFKSNGRAQVLCLSEQSLDDVLGRWLLTDLSFVHTDPVKEKKIKKRKAKTKVHVQLDKMMPPDRSDKLLAIERSMKQMASQAASENLRLEQFIDEKQNLAALLYQYCWQQLHSPEPTVPGVAVDLLPLVSVIPSPVAVPASAELAPPTPLSPWRLHQCAATSVTHTPTSIVVHVAVELSHCAAGDLTEVAVHTVASAHASATSATVRRCASETKISVVVDVALPPCAVEVRLDLLVAFTDVDGTAQMVPVDKGVLVVSPTTLLRLPSTPLPCRMTTDLLILSSVVDLTQTVSSLECADLFEVVRLRPSISTVRVCGANNSHARLLTAAIAAALERHPCSMLPSPLTDDHMRLLQGCIAALRSELALAQAQEDTREAQIHTDMSLGLFHKALVERAAMYASCAEDS
ncbi:hypothetical protein ACHHYP_13603 [Achlya hypogyna]|uniref:Uncharacterized protein n=1 Tax=Achlya hypogyna TaxID=1202772 RepID=A0A1V9ZFM3_ACHHY|nr:hypothetical protein ACHHYP_13603 [Achlya hypogyna]